MSDLFERARAVASVATEAGALGPIRTRVERVEDAGIRFAIRVVESLADKERAARSRPRTDDPFLPYEEALFVEPAGPDHVVLLNKFPVFDAHLLVVTRAFVDQRAPLDEPDFEALGACMAGLDALAFYNAGATAGASQAHKHLQLVPLPLDEGPEPTPIERAIEAGALPYPCAIAATPRAPRDRLDTYRALLDEAGCSGDAPYNLLMTDAWTMIVPRRAERFEGVSVNALGFAGSLLVRDDAQWRRLRDAGPGRVLRAVAG